MRVARIARTMNWKLYVDARLGIVSGIAQKLVDVHTRAI
jgi:hypothetical protein